MILEFGRNPPPARSSNRSIPVFIVDGIFLSVINCKPVDGLDGFAGAAGAAGGFFFGGGCAFALPFAGGRFPGGTLPVGFPGRCFPAGGLALAGGTPGLPVGFPCWPLAGGLLIPVGGLLAPGVGLPGLAFPFAGPWGPLGGLALPFAGGP